MTLITLAALLAPSAEAAEYANAGVSVGYGSAAALAGPSLTLDFERRSAKGIEARAELSRWGRQDPWVGLWAPATTGEVSLHGLFALGDTARLGPFVAVETLSVPVQEQRCDFDGCRWTATIDGAANVHAFAAAFGTTFQRASPIVDGRSVELSLGLQTEDSWGYTVLVPRGELSWRTKNDWEWSLYGSWFDGGFRLGKRFGSVRGPRHTAS